MFVMMTWIKVSVIRALSTEPPEKRRSPLDFLLITSYNNYY